MKRDCYRAIVSASIVFDRFERSNGLDFCLYVYKASHSRAKEAAVPFGVLRTGVSIFHQFMSVFSLKQSSTTLIQLSASKASVQQSSRNNNHQHGYSDHVLLERESHPTVPPAGLAHKRVHRRHSMMHDSNLILILTFIKTSTQVA